jgi:circadian clock protein KaiC
MPDLPLSGFRAPTAGAPTAIPAERYPLVLVVEDDEDTRLLYMEALSAMGYRTAGEPDGARGVEAALRIRPAAVLMDVSMPVLSGTTVQFVLEGVRRGEPCLYANFQENWMQLARCLRSLGADVEDAKHRGLHLFYASPVELQVDRVIVHLFQQIEQTGTRRVVIDAVGDLISAASDTQRLHDHLYALVQHFTVKGVTCILTFETAGPSPETWFSGGRFSYMSDNIVFLSTDIKDKTRRSVAIIKARASKHDLAVHEAEITENGLRVL